METVTLHRRDINIVQSVDGHLYIDDVFRTQAIDCGRPDVM